MKENRVMYHNRSVVVSKPRRNQCDACKRKISDGIKRTNRHHWKYAYKYRTVKANPDLALENTSEYCYHCHQIADALRLLSEVKKAEDVVNVFATAPLSVQQKIRRVINGINEKEIAK
jgi:hypothetical protein